jgi:hypothetical protein
MSSDIEKKISDLTPWERSLTWVELATKLIANFNNSNSGIMEITTVTSELKAAINNRDSLEIERLASKIEGEDEENSLLTKSYLFEKEGTDWHLYGLIMESVSLGINILYINNLVANVPGWFREEFPSALNDIFEVAEKSGTLEQVRTFLSSR